MTQQNAEKKSAVDFRGESRFHLALTAQNLEASIDFYKQLFDAEPTKIRTGYAKWDLAEPSLNLAINQGKGESASSGGVSHFGIQVKSSSQLQHHLTRLQTAGLVKYQEDETACCYARQDKFWVQDPDGHKIEFFLVTEADVVENDEKYRACCG